MRIRLIRTIEQHKKYIAEAEKLIAVDPKTGTRKADNLEILLMVIEEYEKDVFSFDLPSPIESIRFHMETRGLKQKDLIPYIGSKGKVSEILSGKRKLTLDMIRNLVDGLEMLPNVLLQKY